MTLHPVDVLVVAAHPIELAPLRSRLGGESWGSVGRRSIAAMPVGVGMPEAAGGTTEALLRFAPGAVVLLGSYGAYPTRERFVAGTLFVPNRVVAIDAAVLQGKAAFPAPMAASAEVDAALGDDLAGPPRALRRGVLATTLGITTDAALAERLALASSCDGENLEAVAVALSCRRAGIPFVALVGCTNEVGPSGRRQWAQHHPAVAEATAEALCHWLDSPSDALDRALATTHAVR